MPNKGMWQGINSEVGGVIMLQKYQIAEDEGKKVKHMCE